MRSCGHEAHSTRVGGGPGALTGIVAAIVPKKKLNHLLVEVLARC